MNQETIDQAKLTYYKIGGVIRKYRKEKDLKLLDLAAITGIKSAMLSKIENGRMIPTIPTLFTIIQKLGISPEVFFSASAIALRISVRFSSVKSSFSFAIRILLVEPSLFLHQLRNMASLQSQTYRQKYSAGIFGEIHYTIALLHCIACALH